MRVALLAAFVWAGAGLAAEPALDLNRATPRQLEATPGVGPAISRRIVRLRDRNGPYRCVEELRAVPRLTEAQYQALRKLVYVADPDPRCAEQDARRRAGETLR